MKKIAAVLIVAIFAIPVFAEDGKAIFDAKCSKCHAKNIAEKVAKANTEKKDLAEFLKGHKPGKVEANEIAPLVEYLKTVK